MVVVGRDAQGRKIEIRRSKSSELVDILEWATERYEWIRFGWDVFGERWYFTTDTPVINYECKRPVVDVVAPTLEELTEKMKGAIGYGEGIDET